MKTPFFFLLLVFPAASVAQLNFRTEPSGVIIKGATLIDGTGSEPKPNTVVVIRKNRIARISDHVIAEDLNDSLVVDAQGQYIIPGLFDAHLHNSRPSWGIKELERNLLLLLANGVTSAFNVGGDLTLGLMMKQAVEQGRIAGPRMFIAGPIIHVQEGLATARTPEEMTDLVNTLIKSQVDLIKFYTCIKPAMVEAAVRAAHARGIPVSGHHGLTSPLESAELGVDIVHHALTSLSQLVLPSSERESIRNSGGSAEELGNRVALAGYAALEKADWDEIQKTAPQMAATKAYLVSTLNVNRAYVTYQQPYEQYEAYQYLSKVGRQWWDIKKTQVLEALAISPTYVTADTIEKTRKWLYVYWKSGGKVLAGTDAPTLGLQPGFSLQAELERIEQTGIPRMAVIMGATKWAAEAIRQDKELGTIEVGKSADLLILDGDPLAAIRNTRKIRLVIKDGRVYEPQKLLNYVLLEDRKEELAKEEVTVSRH